LALPSEALRRFASKLNSIIDKKVKVTLNNGKVYTGKLYAIDYNSLNTILEFAADGEGNEYPLVIINGSDIVEVVLEEGGFFDAKEFAEFIVKHGIARHMIKVYEDLGVVEVGRGIRITKDGVEGAGPMAQRLFTLYREYLRRKGVNV
jgi:small nuclear ribonucleoprotein (snRNP)-like protein